MGLGKYREATGWGQAALLSACLILTLLYSQLLLAHPSSSFPGKDLSVPSVVAMVRPSVVTVMTRGMAPGSFQHASSQGSGSGIIIDEKGYILTNNHLVEGTKDVVIGLPSGRLTPGRVVGRDFLLDLALIKIQAKDLTAAKFGSSSTLQIGETVVAIGNPFALKGGSTVTLGVVSALDRSILAPNGETLYDLIQTDAAINPGNSGGPLVDLSGRVVGLNVAVAPSAQAISYAIAIDQVAPYIQSMLTDGSVLRPDLGFLPVTVTPSIVASFALETDRGVLAAQVEPSKTAALSGLKSGDVITAVDNVPVYNMGDFWHAYLSNTEQVHAELTIHGKDGPHAVSVPRMQIPRVSGFR
jgi:S1-C subfamily serine protease